MKKINFIVVTFLTSILLTGCGSDIDVVKSGVMNFNKTITVGEAFDNWDNCKDANWEEFETSNKAKVVQFTCSDKNVHEYIEKIKSFFEPGDYSSFDIKQVTQTFRFTINKDDTFQIDNVQEEVVWEDGKKYSHSQEQMKRLESVYSNEISFNPNEIQNKRFAAVRARVLMSFKERGK